MIEICGLTKRFGKVNAVDNLSLIHIYVRGGKVPFDNQWKKRGGER